MADDAAAPPPPEGAAPSADASPAAPQVYSAQMPDGKYVSFGPDMLQDAVSKGAVLEAPAARQRRKQQQQYGGTGNELKAAALGAARGVSFGLSDVGLRSSGLVSRETLAGLQEANPDASTAGEYGGIAASVLAPWLKGVGIGVKAAAGLGDLAAQVTSRGVGAALGEQGASTLARKAAQILMPAAARGAAEGGVYGLGQGISEEALHEKDLGNPSEVAQALLAHVGMGALLGGAASAGLAGAGAIGAAGARRVLRMFMPAEVPADLAAATAAAKAAGETLPEGRLAATDTVAPQATSAAAELTDTAAPGAAADVANAEGPAAAAEVTGGTAADVPGAGPQLPAVQKLGGVLEAGRQTVASVVHQLSGTDRDIVADMMGAGPEGKRVREVMFHGDDIQAGHVRKLRGVLQTMQDASFNVMNFARGSMKASRIADIVRDDNLDAQVGHAYETLEGLNNFINEYSHERFAQGHKGGLLRLGYARDAAAAKIESIVQKGAPDASAQIFMALDDLKRLVGKEAKPGGVVSSREAPVINAVEEFYNGTLQKGLESEALWGKAGTLQKGINERWVQLLDVKKQFDEQFMRTVGRDPQQAYWRDRFMADPEKINNFLSKVGEARNDLNAEIFLKQIEANRQFAEAITQLYEPKGGSVDVAKMIAGEKDAKFLFARASRDAELRNGAKALLQTKTGRAFAQAVHIDRALGLNPSVRADLQRELSDVVSPGARAAYPTEAPTRADVGDLGGKLDATNASVQAIGGQLRQMQADQARVAQLGVMHRMVRGIIRGIGSAVDALEGPVGKAHHIAVPAAVHLGNYLGALPREVGVTDPDPAAGKQPTDEVSRTIRAVTAAAAQPELLNNNLGAALNGAQRIAPEVTGHLAITASRGLAYLAQVAPKAPTFGLMAHQRSQWRPNTSDGAAFMAATRAVVHPMSVAQDLANGTLSRPGVDALAAVYPGIHLALKSAVAQKLATAKKPVPLQQRLRVAQLFDLPTDSLTDPALGAMMAASRQAAQSGPPPRAGTQTDRQAAGRQVSTAATRLGS